MELDRKFHRPWLVAVWPGMGHVAISAGYYLLAKLGMEQFAELSPQGLFDVEFVEVKGGLIRAAAVATKPVLCLERSEMAIETLWCSLAKPNRREKNMRCVAN